MIKIYDYDGSELPTRLRGNGNPWVQWAIIVWIILVLDRYFNPELGFMPLMDLLERWL